MISNIDIIPVKSTSHSNLNKNNQNIKKISENLKRSQKSRAQDQFPLGSIDNQSIYRKKTNYSNNSFKRSSSNTKLVLLNSKKQKQRPATAIIKSMKEEILEPMLVVHSNSVQALDNHHVLDHSPLKLTQSPANSNNNQNNYTQSPQPQIKKPENAPLIFDYEPDREVFRKQDKSNLSITQENSPNKMDRLSAKRGMKTLMQSITNKKIGLPKFKIPGTSVSRPSTQPPSKTGSRPNSRQSRPSDHPIPIESRMNNEIVNSEIELDRKVIMSRNQSFTQIVQPDDFLQNAVEEQQNLDDCSYESSPAKSGLNLHPQESASTENSPNRDLTQRQLDIDNQLNENLIIAEDFNFVNNMDVNLINNEDINQFKSIEQNNIKEINENKEENIKLEQSKHDIKLSPNKPQEIQKNMQYLKERKENDYSVISEISVNNNQNSPVYENQKVYKDPSQFNINLNEKLSYIDQDEMEQQRSSRSYTHNISKSDIKISNEYINDQYNQKIDIKDKIVVKKSKDYYPEIKVINNKLAGKNQLLHKRPNTASSMKRSMSKVDTTNDDSVDISYINGEAIKQNQLTNVASNDNIKKEITKRNYRPQTSKVIQSTFSFNPANEKLRTVLEQSRKMQIFSRNNFHNRDSHTNELQENENKRTINYLPSKIKTNFDIFRELYMTNSGSHSDLSSHSKIINIVSENLTKGRSNTQSFKKNL